MPALSRRKRRRATLKFEPLEPRIVLDSTVVFNEIMYNPSGSDETLEWIELYSQMAVPMDLSGWRLDAAVEFEFPEDTRIGGGEYLIVAKSPADFQADTGIAGALGPYVGSLANSGERIELVNNSGRLMNSIEYDDRGDWPVGPDGSGATLAKIDPNTASEAADAWTTSEQVGGTPGGINFTNDGPATGPTTILVAADAVWRYDDSGTDWGTAWRGDPAVTFNPDDPDGNGNGDDAWAAGPALLGIEASTLNDPIQTVLASEQRTYYFRGEFDFSGTPGETLLQLEMTVDDGAVFYLNGAEVLRYGMPQGTITHDTPASIGVSNARPLGPITLSTGDLVVGTNVLAVELHQAETEIGLPVPAPAWTEVPLPEPEQLVVLSGGGLVLVEEGPTVATAGDPGPPNLPNLANGATAFGSTEYPSASHTFPHINDQKYGNSYSWLAAPGDPNPFVGINLGNVAIPISGIAFGRDNTASGYNYTSRTLGTYTLQYTTEPNPDAATLDASWTNVGTLEYQSVGGTLFATPAKRHRYNFDPITATGIRMKVSNPGIVIDEIELYADQLVPPLTLIQTGGTFYPNNLAASPAVPFAQESLQPGGQHDYPKLNDQIYGNVNSWIGNDDAALSTFAGVALDGPQTIGVVAFGRDNLGTFTDRTVGTYTLQYTTVPSPGAGTPAPDWTSIGVVTLTDGGTDSLRKAYTFDPVSGATGVRLLLSNGETAIDEFEVYAELPPPEPLAEVLIQDETDNATGLITQGPPIPMEPAPGDGRYRYSASPAEFTWTPGILGDQIRVEASWGTSYNHTRDMDFFFDPDGPGGEAEIALAQNVSQNMLADQVTAHETSADGYTWSGFYPLGEFSLTPASQFRVTGAAVGFTPYALSSAVWRFTPSNVAGVMDIAPEPGYSITWDGNDGDYFDPADPAVVPDNLVLDAFELTTFDSSALGTGGLNVADGRYGDSNSWTSDGVEPAYVGLAFGNTLTFDRVAWGRDNGNDVEGPPFTDRSLGTYTIQVTNVFSPGPLTGVTEDTATGWKTVGAVTYEAAGDLFSPPLRHEFRILEGGEPIDATGLRISVSDPAMTIDEIELYETLQPTGLEITPAVDDGFDITWDGNNGDFLGGPVPENLALAMAGTTAFGSGELQPTGIHRIEYANDGLYGNSNSWIPNGTTPAYIGLNFGESVDVERIAWGRSNATSGDICGGGVCTDRWEGTYTLQYTQVETPGVATAVTGDAATGWQTIGDLTYQFADSSFVPYRRHEYQVSKDGGVVSATGMRIAVSNLRTAIDEIEVYGKTLFDAVFGAELSAAEILPDPARLAINEVAGSLDGTFFVEIANNGPTTVDLENYVLVRDGATLDEFVLPVMAIDAGGFMAFDAATLGFSGQNGDRLFLYSPDKNAVLDAVVVDDVLRGRSPESPEEWLYPNAATAGMANTFLFADDVVINEIMYHARPLSATLDTPFTESDEEWIELFNRGNDPVDLGGWSLRDAVRYDFPIGTTIAPGEYVVVAADPTALGAKYPAIRILPGAFSGTLSNSGERILLRDAVKNPADAVRYYDRGRWAEYADGDGSSLELADPNADNARGEAWAASDESAASQWNTYTYSGIARADTMPIRWNEFVMGLFGAGEVLIDDLRVIKDPNGSPLSLLQNGDFETDAAGAQAGAWRILGNHGQSRVIVDPDNAENMVLLLKSTGQTNDRNNHAETTFVGNQVAPNGEEYEISFRAKWLAGTNFLNTRLYFNRLAARTELLVPDTGGTPGTPNSTLIENLGPTYRDVAHEPAVPNAAEPVTVSVYADDPDGIATMTLHYLVNGIEQPSVAMNLQDNGRYSAVIPPQTAATIVQFYVEGADTSSTISYFPAAGADSRVLYKVQDNQASTGPLHNFRIIMTAADTALLHDPANVMSNGYIGATVVYNETEVFYDVGVRLKGSMAARPNSAYLGYNVEFQPDRLFRGVHGEVSIDRSGRGALVANGQEEILVKHMMNHAGDIPSMYDDLIYVVAPRSSENGSALLMMAEYRDVFLDSQYKNGGDGQLFNFDLIYYQRATTDPLDPIEGLKTPVGYGHPGYNIDLEDRGDNKEDYRWHFRAKNNRREDDYGRLIEFLKAMSLTGSTVGSELDLKTQELMDVDQWMRVFAMTSLAGIGGDTYGRSSNLKHNLRLYVRPEDQKVLAFPWDMDNGAFRLSANADVFPSANLRKVINIPTNQRLFYGHLLDLMNTTFNWPHMGDWAGLYGDMLAGQNFAGLENYINARSTFVTSQLPPVVTFAITTADGGSVDDVSATIEGDGWINVREIRLLGTEEALDVAWIDGDTWQLTVPLAFGTNSFTFEAVDPQGQPVGTASITVTSTVNDRPLASWLRIAELNYNPADAVPGAGELNVDNDRFEFIELVNTSQTQSLDLSGVQFIDGIAFTFADGTALAAGDRVLVVRDLAAFESRYGVGLNVAGQYTSGRLNNDGETVTLADSVGNVLVTFTYNDNADWPQAADGGGASLEVVDTEADYNGPAAWHDSIQTGGSPGREADAAVVGRRLFYSGSSFDAAIATDKTALLPGQSATFENVSSFENGINGIAIDLAHAADALAIGPGQFEFLVGNSSDLLDWNPPATAASIVVREGAGRGGSDRIEITWEDGTIVNQWLRVTLQANAATNRLAADDEFYFGSAVGESGNDGSAMGALLVNAADVIAIRDNPRGSANPAAINNPYDVNRDGFVNAVDLILARDNVAGPLSALRWITPSAAPAPPPVAPEEGEGGRRKTESGERKAESGGGMAIAAAKPRSDGNRDDVAARLWADASSHWWDEL